MQKQFKLSTYQSVKFGDTAIRNEKDATVVAVIKHLGNSEFLTRINPTWAYQNNVAEKRFEANSVEEILELVQAHVNS